MTAADNRLFMKVSLEYFHHRKMQRVSREARYVLLELIAHSREGMTDGFIDERDVKVEQNVIDELTSNSDFGKRNSSLQKVKGGYKIRDFESHQMTKEKIEKQREYGRKGGLARQNAEGSAKATLEKKSSVPQQSTEYRVQSTEIHNSSNYVLGPLAKNDKRRGTRIDPEMVIDNNMRDWAETHTPNVTIDKTHAEFVDYWLAVPGDKGIKLDWLATWRNWMRRRQEFFLQDNPTISVTPKKQFKAYED